jgi:hypothetical protein
MTLRIFVEPSSAHVYFKSPQMRGKYLPSAQSRGYDEPFVTDMDAHIGDLHSSIVGEFKINLYPEKISQIRF